MIRKRAAKKKKKKMLAEQDNFNTNSTKETNVGLRFKKKKRVFCAIKAHKVSTVFKKKTKTKTKKKHRQVEILLIRR